MLGVIAGNFDVIHPGYVKMFNQCKTNCDYFLVFLHEDPTIERPEKCNPILSVEERMEILLSLKMIDEVIPYKTESHLYELLKKYQPDIRFLGDDYKNKKFTGDDLNIPIHYLDRSHGWSTTKFKQLIAQTLLK